MSLTGVLNAKDYLPTGRWPDQLSYNKDLDLYKYSLGSSFQIQALDHVHVVNFDLDDSAPYTMELILPVMANLPLQGRMYIFYVSRCHDGDQLTFSTVPLSGDAINGVIGSHTFTLDGQKALYMAVGVNGNYLIHPFGSLTPVAPVINNYNYNYSVYGLTFDYNNGNLACAFSDHPYSLENSWYLFPNGSAGNPFPSPQPVGTTDLVGQIVPHQSFNGDPTYASAFKCLKAGYYGITYHMRGDTADFSNTTRMEGGRLMVIDSTGATVKWFFKGETVTPGTGYFAFSDYDVADEVKVPLDVGDYVWITSAWFPLTSVPSAGNVTDFNVCFLYYGEFPAVAPPPTLALRSAAVNAPLDAIVPAAPILAKNEVVMGSAEDTPYARKKLAISLSAEQKANEAALLLASSRQQQQQAASSSAPSLAPSISLSDIESIVRRVISSSSVVQPGATSAPAVAQAVAASVVAAPVVSSSSSVSRGVASGKKRARVEEPS